MHGRSMHTCTLVLLHADIYTQDLRLAYTPRCVSHNRCVWLGVYQANLLGTAQKAVLMAWHSIMIDPIDQGEWCSAQGTTGRTTSSLTQHARHAQHGRSHRCYRVVLGQHHPVQGACVCNVVAESHRAHEAHACKELLKPGADTSQRHRLQLHNGCVLHTRARS